MMKSKYDYQDCIIYGLVEVLRTTLGGRNGWFYDEILKYGRVHVHVCKKK